MEMHVFVHICMCICPWFSKGQQRGEEGGSDTNKVFYLPLQYHAKKQAYALIW